MYQKYLALLLIPLLCLPTRATTPDLQAPATVLIEQNTGTILLEDNAHTPLPPASVTKIMTILLIMDALAQGKLTPQEIVITSKTAASMGGSQVFLKEGETMELWEMLKCVVVASGNDASVALAEHLHGSEALFVEQMNEKAQELGMSQTLFQNCTGLPAENHHSSAYDIALMSQALLQNHPQITELTTIWMDSIRGGTFDLANTNRLIHDYPYATGLKTGSTDEALFCVSASATQNNLNLIAVVLQGESSQSRFTDAATLLDYGFAHYLYEERYPQNPLPPVPVQLGTQTHLQPLLESPATLLYHKNESDTITTQINLPQELQAPINQGDIIGTFDVYLSGNLQESVPLKASETIPRLNLLEIFGVLFRYLLMTV